MMKQHHSGNYNLHASPGSRYTNYCHFRERPFCPYACEHVIGSQCNSFHYDETEKLCNFGFVRPNGTYKFIPTEVYDAPKHHVKVSHFKRNVMTGR